MHFILGALRAVIELLGLCLLGQGILYLIGGPGRERNPIYQLFHLLTAPPRHLVRRAMPQGFSEGAVSAITFALLFFLWIGLAWMRNLA